MLGVSVMAINVPKEYEVPLYLFHQGKNAEAYKLFGSHFVEKDGVRGVVSEYGHQRRLMSAS